MAFMDNYGTGPSENISLEQSPVLHNCGMLPQGLIENRMAPSCLPPSPLRSSFNPSGTMFSFNYPPPQDSFEAQLVQRLQTVSGYTPPQYGYPYSQLYLPTNSYSQPPLVNSSYTLPHPPKKFTPSPLTVRRAYTESPTAERKISPTNNSEPLKNVKTQQKSSFQASPQSQCSSKNAPCPQVQTSSLSRKNNGSFIKPLSQMGTLTTTDTHGRVRVIIPVPSDVLDDDTGNMLSRLTLGSKLRPAITRSTSEKVPNRSELMSQVQRTAWARHTTK